VTGVGAGKSPARGLGSGCCGLCSGDETAQPRQCATLRDAIDPRENTVCSGGGRGGGGSTVAAAMAPAGVLARGWGGGPTYRQASGRGESCLHHEGYPDL
jgi:hypothetical protein